MPHRDFHEESRTRWVNAISLATGAIPPTTSTWHGVDEIVDVLRPFISKASYLLFPESGGMDIGSIALGREPDTIELTVDEGRAYIAKPTSLTLEYIPAAPAQSFLIIDIAPLPPSGVYPLEQTRAMNRWNEHVVRLPSGQYVDRDVLESGILGHNESGREIPLPLDITLLTRIFRGRLMLVTKGSMWNSESSTSLGTHDRMTNAEIRQSIERGLNMATATG